MSGGYRVTASCLLAALLSGTVCPAARCTTVLDPPRVLDEYELYVKGVEESMAMRFAGELSWIPESSRGGAVSELRAGRSVRWNVSKESVNRGLANRNGTVINWIGAIRIPRARVADVRDILEDYGRHAVIYRPLIFTSRAKQLEAGARARYDVTFGLQNTYKGVSLFPQNYAFQVRSRTNYSESGETGNRVLTVYSRSDEIRESDSGTPGQNDFLAPHHDHGILWALNTYWRARQTGPDVYLEFETVTLARSVQEFSCKIGFVPIPKSIVANVMDALPKESLDLMLTAVRVERERRR